MVLVCHKHEFIFLKTRKTAGTSVEMVLEKLCLPEGSESVELRPASVTEYGVVGRRGLKHKPYGWHRPLRLTEWSDHIAASSVKRRIGTKAWNRCPKITAIRNPFDRMVSYYHFAARLRDDAPTDFDEIRKEFRDFCYAGKWSTDRKVVHLGGKFIIDHAVRFEHMADDLRSIAATLNLPLDPSAIPVTKSMAKVRKKHDVPDYYTHDIIHHVKKRMSWVFDHFDYPLEPQPKFPV